MTGVRFLLDEHVGRVFERVLRERGYEVAQAKDLFGERTTDAELPAWTGDHGWALVTDNAKDFERLCERRTHGGVFLYYDQSLPDEDPEGLARAVEEVVAQYGREDVENSVVDLDLWYDWVHSS